MRCRHCEARARGAAPLEPARSRTIWGADRISGLRCSDCGALLDAEDIAQLLMQKESQLERFGLLTPPRTAAQSTAVATTPDPAARTEPLARGAVRRTVRLEKD